MVRPHLRRWANVSTSLRFQWAAVHLENILRFPNANDIHDALQRPPEGLIDAYNKTFATIKSDKVWGPYVMRAFAWLHARGGSSSITVLVAAASQKPEPTDGLQDLVDADELLKACQFLLVVEKELVRFSHLSVQEYFEVHEEGDGGHFVAMVLLKTLLHYPGHAQKAPSPQLDALYKVASEDWWWHVKRVKGRTEDVDLLLKQFLETDPPSPACRHWLSYLTEWTMRTYFSRHLSSDLQCEDAASFVFSPHLWLDTHGGHRRRFLLSTYGGPDFTSESREAPLLLKAFVAECFIRAKSALATSSDPNNWKILGTPHRHMEHMDRESHVRVANARRRTSRTASSTDRRKEAAPDVRGAAKERSRLFLLLWLFISFVPQVAAWAWHAVCSSMNHPGADVDVNPAAGVNSDIDADLDTDVQPDDEKKAKVEELQCLKRTFIDLVSALGFLSRTDVFWTEGMVSFFQSQQAAPPKCLEELARVSLIRLCHEDSWSTEQTKLVDLLFEKYDVYRPLTYEYLHVSDWNLNRLLVTPHILKSDGHGITTIEANQLYQPRIIEFLARNGANINFVAEETPEACLYRPGTPLIAAVVSYHGRDSAEIMDFLLRKGAEINGQACVGDFGTALIAACALAPAAADRLLKWKDVNVNITASAGKYGTALIAACAENRADVVKRLLRKGAEPGMLTKCGKYPAAFAAALDVGNARIVMLLLNNDPQVNEDLKRTMPSTLPEAIERWSFFRDDVHTPVPNNFDDRKEEWMAQCALAAQQLGVALIYFQNSRGIEWADGHIQKAIHCLAFFSSNHSGDFRAAEIMAPYFGFPNQDHMDLEAWQRSLREGRRVMEKSGWKAVAESLLVLISNLDEGLVPLVPLVQRVATWGSNPDQVLEESDDEDQESCSE